MKHWEKHFRYYDLFQTNYSKYISMLNFHSEAQKNSCLIVDSGAGTGNLTLKLLEDGHQIIAIDNNEKALKILKEKCKKYSNKLKVFKGDLNSKLIIDSNKVDGVTSSFVIPFINIDFYISENYRILKPGGCLSISMGLPKKGVINYVMDNLEIEVKRKRLLPKYEKEWKELWKTSKKNEEEIMKKGLSEKEFIGLLKKNRFKKIVKSKIKPYDDFVLLVKCIK